MTQLSAWLTHYHLAVPSMNFGVSGPVAALPSRLGLGTVGLPTDGLRRAGRRVKK